MTKATDPAVGLLVESVVVERPEHHDSIEYGSSVSVVKQLFSLMIDLDDIDREKTWYLPSNACAMSGSLTLPSASSRKTKALLSGMDTPSGAGHTLLDLNPPNMRLMRQ
jgi:hypothetical protein